MCQWALGIIRPKQLWRISEILCWPEADDLKQTAEKINSLRSEFGQLNPLSIKFLEYCSMRGTNLKDEPRLAQQFLAEIRKAFSAPALFASLTPLHFALYSCTVAAFATPAASMCPVARKRSLVL